MVKLEPIESTVYNKAMRHFASSVHIVTTSGIAGARGLTISSCCSLSSQPPTLLCCVYRNEKNEFFLKNNNFCINTLSSQDQSLAEIFSGRTNVDSDKRFEYGDWRIGKTGALILKSSLISMDCSLISTKIYKTHYILIGHVVEAYSDENKDALIYYKRAFFDLSHKNSSC